MPARVCVLGSVNMDLVARAPRLPEPGETVLGGPFGAFPGGKGANQAVAAARMGAAVAFIGRVGADSNGRALRGALAREGLDLSALSETREAATGVALITVDASRGENTIVVASGANHTLTARDVEAGAGLIRSAGVLLLQLEVPPEANEAGAEIARAAGRPIVLNAAPSSRLGQDMLEAVQVVVANRGEAASLASLAPDVPPEVLARELLRLGAKSAVVTLGSDGAVVAAGGEVLPVETPGVEAVDTVGAGDAFCGALAAMLAEGRDLADAARIGCVAGALATTTPGAIPSLPVRDAVERAQQERLERAGAAGG